MKKTINFWSVNIFLTVVTSLLFNGGVLAGHTGVVSLNNKGMSTIKLSVKNPTTLVRGKSSIVPHPFHKHLVQGIRTSARQKGER